MSREFITQLYLLTPLWLWPVLWVEIYWMQARLDRLLDADNPRDLYEVQLNDWGQLKLVKIYTHIDVPDPDLWRANTNINSDLFASEFYTCLHLPNLRSSLRRQGSLRRIRNRMRCDFPEQAQAQAQGCVVCQVSLGTETLYLDPG